MLSARDVPLLAVAAILVAAGCRSTTTTPAERQAAKDGLTVGESQFMRAGPMYGTPMRYSEAASRSALPPKVLSPESPWIGTLGVTTSLSESMRFGIGIEVPNPVDERQVGAPLTDRLRDTGVGAWVSFDF